MKTRVLTESDIVFESSSHWIKRTLTGYEVYRTGVTHSTRVATIGWRGEEGLARAKAEITRREGDL